ncbi:MAG: carboxypeptidase regulatory-like domain-containing protein [Bacteroidota bacterium]|nr:carboxypeptidase regulatory-like domain-containing protein [Bacteroidota bacterium]
MNLKRILPLLFPVLFFPFLMQAQVTTSSITGFVKSDKGEALEGATVTAVHQPSGTKYVTITKRDGNFTLPNTRIGGPFRLTVEYVGFGTQTVDNITLNLGEPFIADVTLSQKTNVLSGITISANNRPLVAKTGASTVFNSRQIASLPSLTRSITDFTRLTPQASSGNSFAGRDGRYNNLQIDGANLNNNFGLSTDPLPGGGASPISIEAFDEISVNIAPYDVRQSGFTGAGLNVLTKSGTNTFHGSAYGYYRDQKFNGKNVGDVVLTPTPQKNKVYGATLGGPIIQNKLFFFLNAEFENSSTPNANTYVPAGSSASGTASSSPKDSLDKFRSVLKSKYNYDAGEYDNRPNYTTKNRKLLAKIDWNISEKHKLTLKYSDFKGSDQSPLNGSSVPNSGAGGFTISNPLTGKVITSNNSRLPNNRNSLQSIGFSNSDYGTDHIVQSATLELNSNFNSRVSNQLLLAYTHINDTRNQPGALFPTIEIFNGDSTVPGVTGGTNYMSAGTDPFTRNNEVINNIATITDNLTYFAGRHTITAGATYEYQKLGNAFMPGSESYYIFNSLNDFVTNASPAFFSYTYSLIPGQLKVFSANLKVGQLGVYLQDEFNINQNFKLTYGIRGDIPTYLQQPQANPLISALQFPDKNGNLQHFSTGKWPNSTLLLSPRVGFRWKVADEKGLVVRGGTGIFTGKIPFVFLTNMPSNSGIYQNGAVLNTAAQLAGVTFNPNPDAYLSKFPTSLTNPPGSFVLIDPKFKFPQVFRTNFGLDKQLGNGLTAIVDILYTKDINAVKMRNANLIDPSATLAGEDNRPFYPSTTAPAAKYVNPNLAGTGRGGTVIILENTKKGYSFSSTAQLSKSFSKGFFGSLAYTYTLATEISPNPGSQATSAWQSIINRGTPNNEELYNSAYSIPHRIVGNFSYRLEYANHFASTLSLFYEGASQGRYSFIVKGDINGDGNNASDLMYIYSKGSDVPFVNFTNRDGSVKYSIAQQQAAYDQLVANTPYLKNHAGQYAERNSALLPWYNRVDARFLQDFYIKTGNTRHTIQFSVDLINLPNLLDKYWGIKDLYTVNNPLALKSVTADGAPTFNLTEFTGGGSSILPTKPFYNNNSSVSTWGMQLGLRYIF